MAGTRTELQMIKMSEIQSQEVAWLWFPFIPYGKLTIVQGDPVQPDSDRPAGIQQGAGGAGTPDGVLP